MNSQFPPRANDNSRATIVLACISIFVLGIGIGRTIPSSSQAGRALDAAVQKISGLQPNGSTAFSDVLGLIQTKYVKRPVNPSVLLNGAIDGLVGSLQDPYTYYLNPTDTQQFNDELNGTFDGIGAEMGVRNGKIVIIAPLPGTPAEKAGLRNGDAVVKIDDALTDGMTLDEAVRRIRGPRGSDVVLRVVRGTDKPQDVRVTRENIQIKSVTATFAQHKGRTVATVAISNFSQSSASEFASARNDILVRQPEGIILDLRNNSGGYLEAAVQIAEEFIASGPIVIEDYGNGKRETINAQGNAPLARFPVVVLLNGGTASASEILAGALEDRLQAKTVGEQSFGKGSVQELEKLSGGATLKLTIAHWLTPNGRSIDQVGLQPSISIPLTEDDVNANRDPQRDKALELLTTD